MEQYIFNLKMAKRIGLYQILDPNTKTIWTYNMYHLTLVIPMLITIITLMIFPIGLNFYKNDLFAFLYYSGLISALSFGIFKISRFIYNSDNIWKCMDVTSFDFLSSYRRYNRDVLRKWRKQVIRVTYAYGFLSLFIWLSWSFSPLIFNNTTIKIKKDESSYSAFRLCTLNLYYAVSDETFNNYFVVFYTLEQVIGITFLYFTILVDILIISLSFALTSQLETINDAITSVMPNILLTVDNGNYYYHVNM